MDEQILKNYNDLNNSFNKTLIYRIGSANGFFSEYNNMVLTIIYCLVHKIKFVLNSYQSNFAMTGWNKYFTPFCEENLQQWHKKYNHSWLQARPENLKQLISSYYNLFLCYINGVDYLTNDLFGLVRSQKNISVYNIPELGIDGDLLNTCHVIVKFTYRFNTVFKALVEQTINNLMAGMEYVGFHIRRGDKYIESDNIELNKYIEKAESITSLRNAFVSSDDYTVIKELRTRFPHWTFYTLTDKNKNGYDAVSYEKLTEKEKELHYIEFFSSIEILLNSKFCICTYSSNVGMFLKMNRLNEPTFAVDYDEWFIW